ncbi:MAG: hypothetical protein ABW168_08270 [Sedimenticola sp.]
MKTITAILIFFYTMSSLAVTFDEDEAHPVGAILNQGPEQRLVESILNTYRQQRWLSHDRAAHPVWVVEGSVRVSSSTLAAVSLALTHQGERQVAEGEWLKMLEKRQSDNQSALYQLRPRAHLQSPDIMLALDRRAVKPGRSELHAVVIAITALENERGVQLQAGERIPVVAVSQLFDTHEGDTELLGNGVVVVGIGFCNERLPQNRFRYSAEEAAKLDARTQLLELTEAARLSRVRQSQDGVLEDDHGSFMLRGHMKGFRVLETLFDMENCRAVVKATAGGLQMPEASGKPWWQTIFSLFTIGSML